MGLGFVRFLCPGKNFRNAPAHKYAENSGGNIAINFASLKKRLTIVFSVWRKIIR